MTNKWLIGVDLGGTTVKLAIFDSMGEIQHKWEVATDLSEKGQNIIKGVAKAIDVKLEELGLVKGQFLGVGMGAPGPINARDGSIIEAVNLGWKNYPLRDELSKAVGLPAVVENDANVAAYGEMWKGAGQGTWDFVAVTLGTGVGGGIVANGKIISGVNGAGGEVGHMTIILEDGIPCNCGKSGCLETLVSATGIARMGRQYAKAHPESRLNEIAVLTSKDIYQLAAEGDAVAQEVTDRVAYYLGAGLSHIGNTLNPKLIAIGGGVSKAGTALLEPTKRYFKQFTFSAVHESTELVLAELGNDAGVIGAAGLVKNFIIE